MAQYKVPQDVEADDKLLGPFTFRQLVYLMIAAGLVGIAILFFQISPILCIIPVPPILLMLALSLPLKKDQPMETYLAALVSFYTKPRNRMWTPGQSESTIEISAPKINPEENRVRNISGEEATNRLSFLANIVDSQGAAINNISNSTMRDDLAAEANSAIDIFEQDSYAIDQAMKADALTRHEELMKKMQEAAAKEAAEKHEAEIDKMRKAINENENLIKGEVEGEFAKKPTIDKHFFNIPEEPAKAPEIIMPEPQKPVEKPVENPAAQAAQTAMAPSSAKLNLANNQDFSVATIAKQANRIKRKDDGEVFISLH